MARVLFLFLSPTDGLYMQFTCAGRALAAPQHRKGASAVPGKGHSMLACAGKALTAPRPTDWSACLH